MIAADEIIIIEDDVDFQDLMNLILTEMEVKNKVTFFNDGLQALEYLSLQHVIPFMIFSDINMPFMNGFELRDKIHESESLRMKCVPFLFLTSGNDSKLVWEAYAKSAQGFFIKPSTIEQWRELFSSTIRYWRNSKKPQL